MLSTVYKSIFNFATATVNIVPGEFDVHDPSLYIDVFKSGSLGLGEGYMTNKWDTNNLQAVLEKFMTNQRLSLISFILPSSILYKTRFALFNQQTIQKSLDVGKTHYDLSPQLFAQMLGGQRVYSCAFWDGANNLEEAQINKMDLVCRKLNLKKGDTLLDIGCGWGTFANYAATKYGATVTGITISQEQLTYCQNTYPNCTFIMQDYRNHIGSYNKISSIGMAEHVGEANYHMYFNKIHSLLNDAGIALVHTIGKRIRSDPDPWIEKYIFPGGRIPNYVEFTTALQNINLSIEHWDNHGLDYKRTLEAWRDNIPNLFQDNNQFSRMWYYYITCSIASFNLRLLDLWQITLTKNSYQSYKITSK